PDVAVLVPVRKVAPMPARASVVDSRPEGDAETDTGIAEPAAWREQVIALIPSLRAFAWSLSRDPSDADDMVQETLTKAWTHRDKFQPGTNLRAWLFTILRNSWYTALSKHRRETADEDGKMAATLTSQPSQEWSVELHQLQAALNRLPPEHREALIMVGAAGLSYEEAAEIAGCALGTIKSRVNRARNRLAQIMGMDREMEDAA
ncbi:MAG: sigma-70 family RNA polymerase sigma factor, partial [Brevundimonas sp.]